MCRLLTQEIQAVTDTANELNAFQTGKYPYLYPNVDWIAETFRNHGASDIFNLSFRGGGSRLRYYTQVNLVNNAGLALGLAPYQDYEELDMLTMLDTNVKGLMAVTRCFLPAMVKANQGHIINMGSTAGIYAYAGAAVYSATKAAVKTFSDGLRIDTIATDIKVTTIQPGIVETDFSTVRFHGDKERAASVYQGIEALQAQDIADTVVYVTSQPRRVQITDMTIMANQQATGFMVHKK